MSMRMILAAFVVIALGAGGGASAHDDSSGDGTSKCDNWYRPGHTTSTDSHEHNHGSDVNVGDPANTEFHGQSGHYVVRNKYGYVEIVGGQSYRGPDPSGRTYEGQGGYVQGEVDPGSGAPDADFHADTFGPDDRDLPTDGDVVGFVTESKAHGCVNAAGTRVAQETP